MLELQPRVSRARDPTSHGWMLTSMPLGTPVEGRSNSNRNSYLPLNRPSPHKTRSSSKSRAKPLPKYSIPFFFFDDVRRFSSYGMVSPGSLALLTTLTNPCRRTTRWVMRNAFDAVNSTAPLIVSPAKYFRKGSSRRISWSNGLR